MTANRASPHLLLLLAIALLVIPTLAIAEDAPDPLQILGAGGTLLQPLLHGGPAFGAANISFCAEPLVDPDIATGELLIYNGTVRLAAAANLVDLSGTPLKLGLAWIPGDIALLLKYSWAGSVGATAFAPGLGPSETFDLSLAPGPHGFSVTAVYSVEG